MQALYEPQESTRIDTFLVKEEYKPMEQELRIVSEQDKNELLKELLALAYEHRIEK